jgi:hypothetical protein
LPFSSFLTGVLPGDLIRQFRRPLAWPVTHELNVPSSVNWTINVWKDIGILVVRFGAGVAHRFDRGQGSSLLAVLDDFVCLLLG